MLLLILMQGIWYCSCAFTYLLVLLKTPRPVTQQFPQRRLRSLGLRPPRMRGVVNCETVI